MVTTGKGEPRTFTTPIRLPEGVACRALEKVEPLRRRILQPGGKRWVQSFLLKVDAK